MRLSAVVRDAARQKRIGRADRRLLPMGDETFHDRNRPARMSASSRDDVCYAAGVLLERSGKTLELPSCNDGLAHAGATLIVSCCGAPTLPVPTAAHQRGPDRAPQRASSRLDPLARRSVRRSSRT